MVSNCFGCGKPFQRITQGKLFHLHLRQRVIEHFWLCSRCSQHHVIVIQHGKAVLLPKPAAA